ncbi:MAG: RsmB/NOP family class I SAM-dependent RNA methyltransferase [Acidobacteriota bacterium]
MELLHQFDRYRELIDDWPAFVDACTRPLPATLWINTLRLDRDAARARLELEGVETAPLAWYARGLRVLGDGRPGKTLAYITGSCHIQEEVSMLPVALLAPRPGERLLDLCAAPGNKTVQAAVHMDDQGTIVANDLHRRRLGMVVRNLERMTLTNTVATRFDGSSLPRAVGEFDRVIADVPCSCEGTVRKNLEVLRRDHDDRWVGAQIALLRKAVQRCRPGGRIVYATCTFAPEENEAVVDTVLNEHRGELRLLPTRVATSGDLSSSTDDPAGEATLDLAPVFRGDPGLVEWRGRRFDPSLERALRVWPHHNDTGGFFVALLERAPEVDALSLREDEEETEPETVLRRIAA